MVKKFIFGVNNRFSFHNDDLKSIYGIIFFFIIPRNDPF